MLWRVRPRVVYLLLLTLIGIALILWGCAKGEQQPGQQAGTAPKQETIKIGAVPDLSGPTLGVGTAQMSGFETYIKWVNDQGGVNGRKIELLIEDGKYDLQREISLYRKLREQGVLTVGFTWTTGVQSALAPEYVKDKNVVFPGSRTAILFEPQVNPYVFITSPSYDVGYYAMVDFVAQQKPGAKIGVVHPDNTYGQDAFRWIKKRAEQRGVQVFSVILNFDAVDATSQVAQLRSAKPDYVFLILSGRPTKTFLEAAQKLGLNLPMVANYNTAEQLLIELAGNLPIIKNITGVAFYATPADDVPGMRQLLEVGRKYGVPESRLYEQWYAAGWTDAMVLVEGLKRCGDNLTGENLKNAIESIKDFDTGGLTPPLTYGPENHTGTRKVRFTRVNLEKGYWEPISDWYEPPKL